LCNIIDYILYSLPTRRSSDLPFDVGQGHVPEHLPAVGAEQTRGFLFLGALFLHQRDQFTGDEGYGDEYGGEDDAGQGEDDLDVGDRKSTRLNSIHVKSSYAVF